MIKNDKILELERTSEAGLPTFATGGQYKAHARVILQYTSLARAVIEISGHTFSWKKNSNVTFHL